MRKRLTNKIKIGTGEFNFVVIDMLKNIINHYYIILYRMALQGELSYLKDLVDPEDVDEEACKLLHAIDDDVFKLTLGCVQNLHGAFDSFLNINGMIMEFEEEDGPSVEYTEEEHNYSDTIQNNAGKIFNYLVYFKKAKNYRLYLTVLKYYSLSVLHIIHFLLLLLDTGKVEAILIRSKFGRNARYWSPYGPGFFHISAHEGHNQFFLKHLFKTIQQYYEDLQRLTQKKNL